MVVDDEAMIEEVIEGIVERRGCAHASFNDPVEALRFYRKYSRQVTVMITDLTMPGLSGSDLIRQALKINPNLPVVLITGYPNEHIPDDVRSLAARVLPKPFVIAELLDAVATALDKAAHGHPSL